jgi:hypothetical protein
LPTGLAAKFKAAAADPTIMDLVRDLAVLDVRVIELLAKLKPRAALDDQTWAGILELTEHRRRIVLTIQKARFATAAAVSLEQFSAFSVAYANILQEQFRQLMSQTIDGRDERLQAAIRETLGRIRHGLVDLLNKRELPIAVQGEGMV